MRYCNALPVRKALKKGGGGKKKKLTKTKPVSLRFAAKQLKTLTKTKPVSLRFAAKQLTSTDLYK